MTEDPTKDLTTDGILRLILERLAKLEAQIEAFAVTRMKMQGAIR